MNIKNSFRKAEQQQLSDWNLEEFKLETCY